MYLPRIHNLVANRPVVAYFSTGGNRIFSIFDWVKDFSIPTTNNLSERSLRFVKTKDKVSGQFQSIEYASYFADIRTYLETCARNGVNEFTALLRLTSGEPYTVEELLGGA